MHADGTEMKSYSELSDRQTMAALLGTAFTKETGGATTAYNLLNQGLEDYSFPRLAALNHYGDWQADFESGKLVCFEQYANGANTDTLKRDHTSVVTGDGYGVAFDTKPTENVYLRFNGKYITVTPKENDNLLAVNDGTNTYWILTLPSEITNTSTASASFYQKVEIMDGAGTGAGVKDSYWFNPHFAQTAVSSASAATPAAQRGLTPELAGNYPFTARVTDRNGKLIHYGNWPYVKDLGIVGVVYWEQETSGSNNGYKFTMIGYNDEKTDAAGKPATDKTEVTTTLCTAHDDGGNVVSYGYGYYTAAGNLGNVTGFTHANTSLGDRNSAAESAMKTLLPQYDMMLYTTGEGSNNLRLSSTSAAVVNDTWTLSLKHQVDGKTQTDSFPFVVSPSSATPSALTHPPLSSRTPPAPMP